MNSDSHATHIPMNLETGGTEKSIPAESVTFMNAKAVYPCEAEHDSELSFQVGAIFHDEFLALALEPVKQREMILLRNSEEWHREKVRLPEKQNRKGMKKERNVCRLKIWGTEAAMCEATALKSA
ncbi:Rho GTPase-activating protein 10 [Triplophysa tibetana]|uniref:Rho GTPase-activating protein 10 n=1 Tax=Triplophysa tibetana TaxID=1572043 RepID=A0A5A9PKS1_9TELE|nr:Rho GTPase-activating protein 10 [Triplophysa tibetana]